MNVAHHGGIDSIDNENLKLDMASLEPISTASTYASRWIWVGKIMISTRRGQA